jgi:hypothetical protein
VPAILLVILIVLLLLFLIVILIFLVTRLGAATRPVLCGSQDRRNVF